MEVTTKKGVKNMKQDIVTEEIRWQIMKSMLDENPLLLQKVKSYVENR